MYRSMWTLAFCAVAISAQQNTNTMKCQENETLTNCGSACENSCREPTWSWVCEPSCEVPGCTCKDEYLRNTKDVCVLPVDCDTCKLNEIFESCSNPDCIDTCAEPDATTRCNRTTSCSPGCVCRKGYLKESNGECVRPEQCKSLCKDPNEEYKRCGEVCPTTCENKDQGARICPEFCAKFGCVCKSRYVRSWNRTCIKPEECPTCPGPNEFYSCGSACDTTCATLGQKCPIVNIKCTEMCYCEDGYARDHTGWCIPIEECPKQCKTDPNAISLPCGDPCPKTCENKDDGPRPCPRICIPDGCTCKEGFVQDDNGKCIPIEKCPSKGICKSNEIYEKCPALPEKTCKELFSGRRVNRSVKNCKPACRCKDGYVRRRPDGDCILPMQCWTMLDGQHDIRL
ncbi:zonadhesin-like [Arctopsyche grandis]|uniref:zonadhesin-like n=1 Tax=Arctopsyche grandis TaxID=121162 RepID=UPI00406D9197